LLTARANASCATTRQAAAHSDKGKEEPRGPAETGRVRLPAYPSGSVAPSGNRRNPKGTPNWSSLPASPAVSGGPRRCLLAWLSPDQRVQYRSRRWSGRFEVTTLPATATASAQAGVVRLDPEVLPTA